MFLRTLIWSFVLALAAPVHGQMWLRTPRVYEGTNAEFRATGDADGDGDLDLLRVETSGGLLRVMWNDGTGQLTSGPSTAIGTPDPVVYRDLDGNGILDVAYPSFTSIVVRLGLGAGTFGSPIVIPMPGPVVSLGSGDADGDGPDDLVAVHYDPNILQHLAWVVSAGGSFTAHSGAAFSLYSLVDMFAVLDIDGNGVDDIASISYVAGPTATVTVHPTVAATPGFGQTFAPPSTFTDGLVAGDLDADGDPDLVATSWDGQTITAVRYVNSGGTFSALPTQTFSSLQWGRPWARDLNGDGAVEIFARGYGFNGGAHVLLSNDGGGTLAFAYRWSLNIPGDGGGAGFADLNSDGFPDFVGPTEIAFGDGSFQNPFGIEGPGLQLERDWDDDGDLDYFDQSLTLRVNDGRGSFTSVPIVFPAPPPGKIYGFAAVTDDLDGDGFVDYLTTISQLNPPFYPTFIEMRLMHGNGNGSVTEVGLGAPTGLSVGGRFTSDVDGDGDRDVVGSAGVFSNDGSGFFTGPTATYTGWSPIEMRDVDADGDDDFLAISTSTVSFGFALLRRTTPGTLAVEVLLAPTASSGLAGVPSLTDVDGDGDYDVAIDSATSGNAVHVYFNTAGVFAPASQIVIPGPHGNGSAIGSDVDGDGLVDLVLASTLRLHVHRRTGPGLVYEPPRTWANFGGTARTADLDNDGDQDVLTGAMILNTRFHGPTAGVTRQYGQGTSGTGGFRPVLGLQGPCRVGTTERLRVSRAVGGAGALLVLASAEANIPDFGLPGLTAWVQGILDFVPFTLGGAAGQAGKGFLDLPVGPLPPEVANLTVFLQVALVDASTISGFSVTNGVELHHGP